MAQKSGQPTKSACGWRHQLPSILFAESERWVTNLIFQKCRIYFIQETLLVHLSVVTFFFGFGSKNGKSQNKQGFHNRVLMKT